MGLSLSDHEIESLMKAYDSLSTFPDVPPALDAIAKNDSITAVVLYVSLCLNSISSCPPLLLAFSLCSCICPVLIMGFVLTKGSLQLQRHRQHGW